MSKIANNGLLSVSNIGCFIAVYPYGKGGRQRVNRVLGNVCSAVASTALEMWINAIL